MESRGIWLRYLGKKKNLTYHRIYQIISTQPPKPSSSPAVSGQLTLGGLFYKARMQMPHGLWSSFGAWVTSAGENHALDDTEPWNGAVDQAKDLLHFLTQQSAGKKAEGLLYHAVHRRDAVLSSMTLRADTRTTCVLADLGEMGVYEPRPSTEVLHLRG